jgi:phosphatidylserine/phosphatidylglycerophosphate/cardiolipin synthase-like enzyme
VIRALLLALGSAGLIALSAPAHAAATVYFSPWDDAEGALIETLAKARKSVHVQAYLLTSRNIARALLAAHQRGVRVAVLADQGMADKGNSEQLDALVAAGIEVALETRYAAAHNKVMLIDASSSEPVLVTGSYNFTWSAQARNAENLLVLTGEPELTRRYLANWQRHRRDALPYAPSAAPIAAPPAPTSNQTR